MRPRLLIAEPHAAHRLILVDALREPYEVIPLPEDEDPVRGTRRIRPDLLLLAIPPGRVQAALRACRSLKTEASPPRVALFERTARVADPPRALEDSLADGLYVGVGEATALRAFVQAVLAGQHPVARGAPAAPGLLERLLPHRRG